MNNRFVAATASLVLAGTVLAQNCDLNADGAVNTQDTVDLLACIGQPPVGQCAASDRDGDGTIDGRDFDLFLTLCLEGEDYDNDGIVNSADNCPRTHNPEQGDSDADGVDDDLDTQPATPSFDFFWGGTTGTIITPVPPGVQRDRDDDGAGNNCEVPCRADFNNDGFINSQDFFDFLTSFFGGC